MARRNRLAVVSACAVVLVSMTAAVRAQSVSSYVSAWNNLDNIPNPGVSTSLYLTNTVNGNAAGNKNVTTPDFSVNPGPPPVTVSPGLMGQLQLSGIAIQDGVGVVDAYTFSVRSRQRWQLNEQARVFIPAFLSGGTTFGVPIPALPNAATTGGVTVLVRVIDEGTGLPAGPSVSYTVNRDATQGDLAINDRFDISNAVLPAGNYTLQATFTLNGTAGAGTVNGASVTQDFISTARSGLASSFAAVPDVVLGNSRGAVGAVAARARYGVNGSGVRVGILEPGQVYNTHDNLPGVVYQGGVNANDFSEHTLAVASIIGARGPGLATGSAGVAPGVTIRSASTTGVGVNATANAIIANVDVINMSAGGGSLTVPLVDALIEANPRVTFVKSAGNRGTTAGNNTTVPAMSPNIIAVGALNRDFTRRAEFSSFSDGASPIKPDIMAPGEYINAAQSRDVNNNTSTDDFGRVFLGDDFTRAGATTGAITGTSFAAPHVSGAAALLYDYARKYPAKYDADAVDFRVIKANLLFGASKNSPTGDVLKRFGGADWAQETAGTLGELAPNHLKVTRSIDPELGAGMLRVDRSLRSFDWGEVRKPDNNAATEFVIDAASAISGVSGNTKGFWDFERVLGRVDYILGDINELTGASLRALLTWGTTGGTLEPLNLQLWRDSFNDFEVPGYDDDDTLIAETTSALGSESVKLLDFIIPDYGNDPLNNSYYLSVTGVGRAVPYGIVVSIPEPAGLLFLTLPGVLLARRPRR